jgi:reverse gyrase
MKYHITEDQYEFLYAAFMEKPKFRISSDEYRRLEAIRNRAIAILESVHLVTSDSAKDEEIERLENALHRISLASQNSMSSKEECGRIARVALEGGES